MVKKLCNKKAAQKLEDNRKSESVQKKPQTFILKFNNADQVIAAIEQETNQDKTTHKTMIETNEFTK